MRAAAKIFPASLSVDTRRTLDIIEKEKSRSNISILEANQEVQRSLESGKILLKRHEFQALNLENQNYQILLKIHIYLLFVIMSFHYMLKYLKSMLQKYLKTLQKYYP